MVTEVARFLSLHVHRELCNNERREIRPPDLLIWSRRYRRAMHPLRTNACICEFSDQANHCKHGFLSSVG